MSPRKAYSKRCSETGQRSIMNNIIPNPMTRKKIEEYISKIREVVVNILPIFL